MKRVLVSACLLGENVRYNAEIVEITEKIRELEKKYRLISVCPEVLGGLDVPREPCEIVYGSGADVLDGRAKVFGNKGTDCTSAFIKGAKETLKLAKEHNAEFAVLKERSPSCGGSIIYSGDFDGKNKKGEGVTSAILRLNGIKVISENDI